MKNLLIFISGAAIGSFITWKLVDKHYQELADEEIQSVVETFKNREKKVEKEKVENIKEEVKLHYNDTLDAMKYVSEDIKDIEETLIPSEKKKSSSSNNKKISVIPPEEFGEKDGYDTKSYMYWNDGVLTDDFDQVVNDPSKIIGDALKHFGDYEDDAVYVRNSNQKCDYEILKSEKDFND